MLKKNIPTHIRRAHTPKEELVCLNEEQNIFTFHHLKPGQRRKRSTRAYDYNLMTSNVSINEYENCDEIENKFITEGQEILSSDLLHLAGTFSVILFFFIFNCFKKNSFFLRSN